MNPQFGVLGSVEARAGGGAIELGHAKQQCVLAVLLVDAGRPVPVGQLIERVWGADPPERVQNALYSYVSRLRRALPGTAIRRGPGGYTIIIDRDSVDLHRFRRLVELARDPAADAGRRLSLLDEALALWRGEPFAHLDSPWFDGLRVTLAAERMAAELDRDDLLLRAGQHADLLPRLADRVSADSLNERLVGQFMLALYRSGRQADALEQYQLIRRRLSEEIGSDPGEPLQRLHQQLLAGDTARPVPRQLPPDIAAFAGRADELSTIDSASTICVITGMAGVGKTALAVRAAHRMAGRFPDGQLYVNLRGFDPSGAPKPPAEALRGFLEALGVAPHTAPGSVEALTAHYRSLVADRRMLVVLDNARDAEQVRPLLPASPGCLTLITSRDRLTGLVATEGARAIGLDVLSTVDAQALLRGRLGGPRIDGDPDATRELIARCAHLPLALAVVAARAAMHPEFPLRAVAQQLRTLDAFADPDPMADVRAVFSWSYRAVSPAAARLFRLLALHPGPDVTAPAAASILGDGGADTAGAPLAELERAHLIAQHAPGRYSFHDLLRAHAAELADDDRAVERVLDHYMRTGHRAALLLNPHRDPVDPGPPSAGVMPEPMPGFAQALAWFDAEHAVLLACIDLAVAQGFDATAWHLAWTLSTFFARRGHLHDWAATQSAALGAAQRLGDLARQAHAHRDLGRAQARLAHTDEALANMARAIDIYRELDDAGGRAHVHVNMGIVFERLNRYQEAIKHAYAAVELFRVAGNRVGQARTHNNIGWYHAHLGEYRQAVEHCREALGLQEALDDVSGQAASWDSLGYVHHHLGERDEAIACFHRAMELSGSIDDRHNVADILIHLGDAHQSFGGLDQARDAWAQALEILDVMRHPDAAKVRAKLVSLGRW
ncbi:AfsR/SARP family transcriptional regulator [Allorhizocola rhizosphaerae]|uniref:AfsR/SARP family transcriptional regulator n=1 Tax=Allorhizocola rhizosphaerae TaxID=1872709 RepID=UPI001B8AC530|nr:BTAD domain-containing putative transcriptional regulator [Allorhizocola rhizosphaerae]